MLRLTLSPGVPVMSGDVIGATSLFYSDIGVAGPSLSLAGLPALSMHDIFYDGSQIYAVPMPDMEVLLTGTPIGGMVGNGGLAAAFDGVMSKNYLASAKSPGGVTGFSIDGAIGLALPSPQAVTRMAVTGPTNSGINGSGANCPWQLLGSNTNNIATAAVISNGLVPPSASNGVTTIDAHFPAGAAYSYYWFQGYGNGANAIYAAQLQLFANQPAASRGLVSCAGVLMNSALLEYLGTIQIGDVAGQMDFTLSYGLKRRVPIWNAKNRVRVSLRAGDNGPNVGGHYVYAPAQQLSYAFAPARGNDAINIRLVSGLAENFADLEYRQTAFQNSVSPAAPTAYWFGVAVGSKSTPSGFWSVFNFDGAGLASAGAMAGQSSSASYKLPPFYGSRTIYALEGARGNVSSFWGEWSQELTADWEY